MQRVASLILFAGAVLILTWVGAPAAPPSAPSSEQVAANARAQASAPILAEVTAQVERLRERLAAAQEFPKPGRDPFQFGARPEAAARPVAPAAVAPAPPVAPPPVPRLVAVMTTTAAGSVTRTAAIADGAGDVTLRKIGDTIGAFVVRRIDADAVELVEPVGGATFRITIK